MKNVMIVGGGYDYERLFISLGYAITNMLGRADLVCFTGGADVTPEIYGDKQHALTGNDVRRDAHETNIFQTALANEIPMVGICRGGQFLNVMCGGRMYQHVSKHTMPHTITDLLTGETIYVSSTHHQMMMPAPEAVLVASSTLGGTREWFDGAVARKDVSKEDIEVVFYPIQECLCFQPHPEFDRPEYEGMKKYFASLLDRFFV